ncbi:TPA: hypothetical protein NQG29_003249 [Enterobacter cloacae]|nr:hypothetical protein [Enterobacter cloacae]HCJ0088615.1 hypothetical protein [Enterobacter cloacae]
MDESRKQFEQKIQHSYGEDYLVINNDGDYVNWITADLWEFWQESRAAIEIELPKKIEREEYDTDFDDGCRWGHNDAISTCAGRIRAAGIKVKE